MSANGHYPDLPGHAAAPPGHGAAAISPPSSAEQKRFRRHLRKASGACALCGADTLRGQALEWLDVPVHPERGPIFFLLCATCTLTDYREQLNVLHRRFWEARHAHDR